MTFEEAEKHLDAMAPGKYRSLKYERPTNARGPVKKDQVCSIYVAGYRICSGFTWKDALGEMEREINPQSAKLEPGAIEELPVSGAGS